MQHEITESSNLLDSAGRLVQCGWARQPLLTYNPENLAFYRLRALQFLRLKEWDYYAVFTPRYFVAMAVANLGYADNVFAYLLDFEQPWMHEESLLIPLARGVSLPHDSQLGDVHFDNGTVHMEFRVEDGGRRLVINWPNFHTGAGLTADIQLRLPPRHESVVMATPIGERRFYYNRKLNCLPASGWLRYAGQTYSLDPTQCLGGLDWGRGVWEYRSFWNWASASAYLPDGRSLGLNLGEGFGDLTAASENAFILDGCVHKLDQVPFVYNPSDYMQPWCFVSSDGALDLTFTPFYERVARSNVLIISSEVHQMFGHYSGRLRTAGGEQIEVRDLLGFAEEHHARW